MNGRQAPIDVSKGRSDDTIERRGAVVLLISDAQPSHIIDVRPKSPHRMPFRAILEVDVAEDENQAGVGHTAIFDISLLYQYWGTGAFAVFTRRVQLWEVNDLVAAL